MRRLFPAVGADALPTGASAKTTTETTAAPAATAATATATTFSRAAGTAASTSSVVCLHSGYLLPMDVTNEGIEQFALIWLAPIRKYKYLLPHMITLV